MKTKTLKRNYLTLLLLGLIFACPGIAAFELYRHPQWLASGTLNKGKLLNPPERFVSMNAKAKWRLMLWNPGECGVSCRTQIEKLAKIRLALGRRLYLVDVVLVMNNPLQPLLKSFMKNLVSEDIRILFLNDAQRHQQTCLSDEPQIFIVNPDDYLVLAYPVKAASGDVFYDIGKLLSIEGKKSSG